MTLDELHSGLEFILAHIIQDFMQFMHRTGLSRPQIHALLHIYHSGECPVSEIGRLTGSSKAAASQRGGREQEKPGNPRRTVFALSAVMRTVIKVVGLE